MAEDAILTAYIKNRPLWWSTLTNEDFMQNQTQETRPCAVFPLSLVRKALETSRNKMNRVTPEKYNRVVFAPSNLSFVQCGQWPLIATVGVKFKACFSKQYSGAYVNTKGEAVFAG